MKSKSERKSARADAASSRSPAKKRFRIEKLEERITPKKGGGGQLSSGLTYSASVGGPY